MTRTKNEAHEMASCLYRLRAELLVIVQNLDITPKATRRRLVQTVKQLCIMACEVENLAYLKHSRPWIWPPLTPETSALPAEAAYLPVKRPTKRLSRAVWRRYYAATYAQVLKEYQEPGAPDCVDSALEYAIVAQEGQEAFPLSAIPTYCIKNPHEAAMLLTACYATRRELFDLCARIHFQSERKHNLFCRVAAEIALALFEEFMLPIYRQHPEFVPDTFKQLRDPNKIA